MIWTFSLLFLSGTCFRNHPEQLQQSEEANTTTEEVLFLVQLHWYFKAYLFRISTVQLVWNRYVNCHLKVFALVFISSAAYDESVVLSRIIFSHSSVHAGLFQFMEQLEVSYFYSLLFLHCLFGTFKNVMNWWLIIFMFASSKNLDIWRIWALDCSLSIWWAAWGDNGSTHTNCRNKAKWWGCSFLTCNAFCFHDAGFWLYFLLVWDTLTDFWDIVFLVCIRSRKNPTTLRWDELFRCFNGKPSSICCKISRMVNPSA